MHATHTSAVPDLRQLLTLGPHAGAHRVGLRLALSALVPLLVLWKLGRIDLAPYAFLPTTVAVFGRNAAWRTRLVMQIQVATVLVGLIIAGAALACVGMPVLVVVVAAGAVAAGSSMVADHLAWTPAGSLFFLFAFVVSASAPVAPSMLPDVAIVAVFAAVVTILITASGALPTTLARQSGGTSLVRAAGTPPRPSRRLATAHGVAAFAAVVAAGIITVAHGSEHPYWAMVSAVVPIAGVTTVGQLTRATHRIAGTVLGLVVTAAILAIARTPLELVLALVLCVTATELFVARNYAVAMLFVTPATIGMLALNDPQPLGPLLAARVAETCIGVAVAFVAIVTTHSLRHPAPAVDDPDPEPAGPPHPPASADLSSAESGGKSRQVSKEK